MFGGTADIILAPVTGREIEGARGKGFVRIEVTIRLLARKNGREQHQIE